MDLVVTVRVSSPAHLVFKAFTDPDGLDQYWTRKSQIEPRAGGRFRLWYRSEGAEGEDDEEGPPDAEGVYSAFQEGRLVEMRWAGEDGAPDENPVRVRFHPNERGGTDVELTHAGLDEEDEEALEELYDGWEEVLAGLKSVAERWEAKARKAREAAAAAEDARRGGSRRAKR